MSNYEAVLSQDIWLPCKDVGERSRHAQIRLAYDRARSICQHTGMQMRDIAELTDKFFEWHCSMWAARDSAACTILSIHWNLCMGTIIPFAKHRADLQTLLDDLQKFKYCGEFLLTEVGHGLDARNIETTATLQLDGSFILHSPTPTAAKAMPPTTPWAGVPRIGVVMARLIVDGEDRGVKPFVVRLTEKDHMCPGVTSRLLPFRAGARPVDHALTSFHHVKLESKALLGCLDKPKDARLDFFQQIRRVSVGTLALSMGYIASLRSGAYIVSQYSRRRLVSGPTGPAPIMQFSTQYRPIILAAAHAIVFEEYAKVAVAMFRDASHSYEVRHAVAATFKATITHACQPTLNELIDRCGHQGLYGHNGIIEYVLALRGNTIAEGDVLVLCIRMASEVLQGRYGLPPAQDPTSLLARHESGVWEEALKTMVQYNLKSGRSAAFNEHILPRCRALVEATGHRMAYEAAKASKNVSPEMLALFESSCVMADPSWYCEYANTSRAELFRENVRAVGEALPQLDIVLGAGDAEIWSTAPIIDETGWLDFVQHLPAFHGESNCLEDSLSYHEC